MMRSLRLLAIVAALAPLAASAQISNLQFAQGSAGCIGTGTCTAVVNTVRRVVFTNGCTLTSSAGGEADLDCTSALGAYLPLAGGTMTGDITLADSATSLKTTTYGVRITSGVANSGTNVAFILNAANTLSGTTRILALTNNTTEKFTVEDDGTVTSTSGAYRGPSFGTASLLTADGGSGMTCAGSLCAFAGISPDAGATSAYWALGKFVTSHYNLGTSTAATKGFYGYSMTAAAAGAQQYSPLLSLQGNGWKTDATAASQTVLFQLQTRPVQGAAAPTGQLDFLSTINGGSTATPMTLSDTGVLTLASGGKVVVTGGFDSSTAPSNSTVGPSTFCFGDSVSSGNTTAEFLDPWYQISTTSTTEAKIVAPFAFTARNLYVYGNTAYSGGSVINTVRKNAADQALTCTQTAGSATCSDTTHSVTFAAGDQISIKKQGQAGISAGAQRVVACFQVTVN